MCCESAVRNWYLLGVCQHLKVHKECPVFKLLCKVRSESAVRNWYLLGVCQHLKVHSKCELKLLCSVRSSFVFAYMAG